MPCILGSYVYMLTCSCTGIENGIKNKPTRTDICITIISCNALENNKYDANTR